MTLTLEPLAARNPDQEKTDPKNTKEVAENSTRKLQNVVKAREEMERFLAELQQIAARVSNLSQPYPELREVAQTIKGELNRAPEVFVLSALTSNPTPKLEVSQVEAAAQEALNTTGGLGINNADAGPVSAGSNDVKRDERAVQDKIDIQERLIKSNLEDILKNTGNALEMLRTYVTSKQLIVDPQISNVVRSLEDVYKRAKEVQSSFLPGSEPTMRDYRFGKEAAQAARSNAA